MFRPSALARVVRVTAMEPQTEACGNPREASRGRVFILGPRVFPRSEDDLRPSARRSLLPTRNSAELGHGGPTAPSTRIRHPYSRTAAGAPVETAHRAGPGYRQTPDRLAKGA